MESLSGTLKDVVDTVGKTQHHQERLETDSKRLNLKLYGIEESANEFPAENEQKVKSFVSETLGVETADIEFESVQRLHSMAATRQILARLLRYKHREQIMKAYREKRKHANLEVRVGEDLPQRISRARIGLYPLLKESVDAGKVAFFRDYKLVVGDQVFIYDVDQKKPVNIQK